MRELLWAISDRFHDTKDGVEEWFLEQKNALYGAAACRIGIGLALLFLLVGNFSTRNLLAGPASIWAEPARAISNFPEIGLLRGASPEIVTIVYVLVLASTAALILGWHTRVAVVVTLIGHIAILSQNPVVGGQGDNVIRLALLWLLLIDSSQHWSLDRRRREKEPAEDDDVEAASGLRSAMQNSDDVLPSWLSNGLHNIALCGLAAQTVIIYMTAGLSKITEEGWRQGNALYYTMQLPDFRPFPRVSDLFSSSEFLLAVITYGVLFTQLFFGPLLLNRATRAVAIGLAVVVNLFFGLVMALPVSSLALIAVTALFISSRTFEAIGEYADDLTTPLRFWFADRYDDLLDKIDDLRKKKDKPEKVKKSKTSDKPATASD